MGQVYRRWEERWPFDFAPFEAQGKRGKQGNEWRKNEERMPISAFSFMTAVDTMFLQGGGTTYESRRQEMGQQRFGAHSCRCPPGRQAPLGSFRRPARGL